MIRIDGVDKLENKLAKIDTSTSLIRMEKMTEELAEITSIEEIKKRHDYLTALEQAAKLAGGLSTIQNKAAELKIRHARRGGQVLTLMKERGERMEGGDAPSQAARASSLKDIGFTWSRASRWQKIGSLPEKSFEDIMTGLRTKAAAKPDTDIAFNPFFRLWTGLKREKKRKINEALIASGKPLEMMLGQKFQTIVIDPPWSPKDEGDIDQFGRGQPTYKTMTIEEILALPIENMAEKNCHLYLWITNRSLPKGFGLMEKWGFRYVTMITWVKPSFGIGNYFRGSTEHILFGIRGSLPLLRSDQPTHFEAPRPGIRHSGKPEFSYKIIETCSPGPWIQIFGGEDRSGWARWGALTDENIKKDE